MIWKILTYLVLLSCGQGVVSSSGAGSASSYSLHHRRLASGGSKGGANGTVVSIAGQKQHQTSTVSSSYELLCLKLSMSNLHVGRGS